MKKRLEADLISIAHRILQLKNKSDINQLYLETQKLYEKLALLRFVDEHFGEAKPTIGQTDIMEKMEHIFENNTIVESKSATKKINAQKIDVTKETIEPIEIVEANIDQSLETQTVDSQTDSQLEERNSLINKKDSTAEIEPILEEPQMDSISEPAEKMEIEPSKKTETVQISFEDLLGGNYTEPKFVKITQLEETPEIKNAETSLPFDFQKPSTSKTNATVFEKEQPKSIATNTKLGKGIAIGLNDRIAFVKHLFGGNSEDYNRVLNQLITFDTFPETQNFIDEMVKPDYNNWDGKEDFEHRFMEIIEKKFLSF